MKKRLNAIYLIMLLGMVAPLFSKTNIRAIAVEKVDLLEAIEKISMEYEVYFTFDMTLVADVKVEYTSQSYASAEDAISAVLQGTDLKYQFYDHRFVIIYRENAEGLETLRKMSRHLDGLISEGEKSMEEPPRKNRRVVPILESRALSRSVKPFALTVSGTVVDQTGEPLIGVNIQVKGTNQGTSTDFEGKFVLEDVNEQAVLVVSYIGYQTREITVAGRTSIQIILMSDSKLLDEIVVVGYGQKKKANLTAAVDMIDQDILANRPVENVGQMLTGAVPNLNVNINSGAPDATPTFNIRGFTGFGSLGSPLVLIDGVEQDVNMINPNDVESISVLKGAAASAIYGSRAPNGILLITTKSGQKSSPMRVNYAVTYNINTPYQLPATMNSVDYARYQNMSFNNSGAEVYYTDETIQAMRDYIQGKGPQNSKRPDGLWKEHIDAHGNTDYYGVAFRDHSNNMSHNLNMSGGGESTSYYMGVGYTTKQGVYNSKIDEYDRISTILKINSDINEWLKVGMNTRYSRIKTLRPNFNFRRGDDNGRLSGMESDEGVMRWISYFPNIPVKNPDGSYHRLSSLTVLDGLQGQLDNTNNDFWITPSIELSPLKSLRLRTSFSWNTNNQDVFESIFQAFVDGGNGVLRPSARSANYDGIIQNTIKEEYYQFDSYLEFDPDLQSHDIVLLVGFQQEYNKYNGLTASRRGLYNTTLPAFSTAFGDQMTSDRIYEWATRGIYFRGSYNFQEKYLIDFNGRYDASSKFSPQTRWAFFPSVSVGYNMAKENYWPLKESVDMFKLTAQWGKSGNHGAGTGNGALYTYLPTMGTGTTGNILEDGLQPYVSIPPLLSKNLTWAKPRTIGFGIEAGLFDSRLVGEYRWYQRTVFDQFSPPEILPEVLGTAVPAANNGISETRGWEASLTWSDRAFNLSGSPLLYKIRAIVSDYIGYVVAYQANESGIRTGWTPGQEFGVLYGYESAGIAPNEAFIASHVPVNNDWYYPGDLYFKDLNGDGQINTGQGNVWYSQGDRTKLGYTYPRFKYSAFLHLNWRSLSLGVLLDGVGHQMVFTNNYQTFGFVSGGWSARTALSIHEDLGGYWALDNQDAFFPRTYQNTKNTNQANDQYALNLAHLLVKNINFSYTLPDDLVQRIQLNRASLNFSIENPTVIFNKSWLNFHPYDLDSQLLSYPVQRIFSVGINIGI